MSIIGPFLVQFWSGFSLEFLHVQDSGGGGAKRKTSFSRQVNPGEGLSWYSLIVTVTQFTSVTQCLPLNANVDSQSPNFWSTYTPAVAQCPNDTPPNRHFTQVSEGSRPTTRLQVNPGVAEPREQVKTDSGSVTLLHAGR